MNANQKNYGDRGTFGKDLVRFGCRRSILSKHCILYRELIQIQKRKSGFAAIFHGAECRYFHIKFDCLKFAMQKQIHSKSYPQ